MQRGLATAAAALLLLACGPSPPPSGDLSLPPLARAVVAARVPESLSWRGTADAHPTGEPARVAVGESERLALLTREGVSWEVPVSLRPGDRLRWAVAAADGEGTVTGRLELEGRSGTAVLRRVTVDGSEGWRPEEMVADGSVEGRLRVVSDGPRPLAWAGLRVVRRQRPDDPGARPNVILVCFDTLRADRLSLYGYQRPTSPHLDRFADDALVFDRALSSSTWTLPGHGSLFTGLLPDRHGLTSIRTTLDPRAVTLAERLRSLGYRTVALTDGGFLDPRWGLSRGFDRYDTTPGQPWDPKDAAVIARRAAAWMEEARFEPYFLFLHSYETHQPYADREGFAEPWLPAGTTGGETAPNVLSLRPAAMSEVEIERIRALYDGGVRRLDHHLGALLEGWRDGGRLRRTAVLVTSDHGEELAEHGGFEHAVGKVFDENVRVPMIVRPAGGVDGRRVAVPVTSLDVAPTVLGWAGASEPRLVGRPLLRLAESGGPGAERRVIVQGINSLPELDEWNDRLDHGPWTVVSDRRRDRTTFYDRAADPSMEHPLTPAAARDAPAVPAIPLVARLQTVVAWASGRSTHAAALPPLATAVRVDGGGGVVPRGVLDGLGWQPMEPGATVTLNPGVPAVLAFDLEGRGSTRRVWLEGVEPGELELTTRRAWAAEDWNPVTGELPGVGEIFPTAPVLDAGNLELSDDARKELEALGYL